MFSPDGKILASGSGINGSLFLWNVATGKRLRTFVDHQAIVYSVNGLAFSPDGRTLVSGGGREIRLWNVTTGSPYRILKTREYGANYRLAFSPGGDILASSSLKETFLWDIKTGKQLKMITGHTYSVTGLAFSQDNSTFVSVGGDGTVILWDLAKLRGGR